MNPVRAGRYDKRVEIEAVTTAVSDDGSPQESWVEFGRRWARVVPETGREYALALQVMADVSLVLEMRFIAGVTPRHRVRFRGRLFEIGAAINVEEQNRVTLLYCKEKVN